MSYDFLENTYSENGVSFSYTRNQSFTEDSIHYVVLKDFVSTGDFDQDVVNCKVIFDPGNKKKMVRKSRNLFDKTTVTVDTVVLIDGTEFSLAGYSGSALIPVMEGELYNLKLQATKITAYDSLQAASSGDGEDSEYGPGTWTVPAGIAFVRITMLSALVDTFQFNKGNVDLPYEAYGTITEDQGETPLMFASYGDSITVQNTWQPTVAEYFNFEHTAVGVNGRRISGATGLSAVASIATIPFNSEVIVVHGGINDFANAVALGDINTSVDTTTVYGSLNLLHYLLRPRFPDATLLFLTTLTGVFGDHATNPNLSAESVNTLGLTPKSYSDAIIAFCEKFGYAYVDGQQIGISPLNKDLYFLAEGDPAVIFLHPNEFGGKKMASSVITKLESIL